MAAWIQSRPFERVQLVPAGERWPDGSLRPALEDGLGAGAVLSQLAADAVYTPDAQVARETYLAQRHRLAELIRGCPSGQELIGRGFAADVELALESRLSDTLRASLAYTQIDAVYSKDFTSNNRLIESGNKLPGIPARTLYGELAWQPLGWFSTAVEGLYRSQLYVEDSNTAKAAPSYALFNWQARFEQKVGAMTFNQVLRIDNLLDREYIGSVIVGDGMYAVVGEPGASWLTTGDFGDLTRWSMLRRVVPSYRADPTTATMTNFYRSSMGAAPVQDATVPVMRERFDVRRSARWHRARFDWTGRMTINGIEVDTAAVTPE